MSRLIKCAATEHRFLCTRLCPFNSYTRKMPENKVFITRKVGNEAIFLLEGKCTVKVWNSEEPIPKDELLIAVKGISGLFCTVSDIIDAEVLDAAGIVKKLARVISLELLVVFG